MPHCTVCSYIHVSLMSTIQRRRVPGSIKDFLLEGGNYFGIVN